MERVAIIGCGGSGKSTIAKRLGALLNLPVSHLDALYYDENWNPLPLAEFAAKQELLVAGQRWLIEGNYATTLPIRLAAADTVIFLDLPAPVCLWGIVQRALAIPGRATSHRRGLRSDQLEFFLVRMGLPQIDEAPRAGPGHRTRGPYQTDHAVQPESGQPVRRASREHRVS
ncbi:hypothetical protein Rhe02_17720 [Rhizocola hellebori]|uniref:Topology modulation protein n=1 Tax=Rhizocola hellebori TaxID=1392758 RepID=A0A8J3Q4J8_9ACTN|nr:hypothetical protein [Rhizocola hellebori]GIH03705.1 hypothetical protein Rhe02_17720 [Rhizocola hellebori]